MGNPVSPVVANLCMAVVEDFALATTMVPPKIWKHYVDDSFVITTKILKSIDSKISFTLATKNNGKIVFLDTLVSRNNGIISMLSTGNQPIPADIWTIVLITRRNTKLAQLPLFYTVHPTSRAQQTKNLKRLHMSVML